MQYDDYCLNLIRELSDARGPSGFEDEVVEAAKRYASAFSSVEEDCLRNVYFRLKTNTGNRPVVMLDAHSDEVGFMVHSIRPCGTLRVVNLGRWTNSTLPASKVKVRNAEGEWLSGVFVNKPAHFRTAADSVSEPAISELSIDIGATSAQEAREVFKIRMGEPVVPASSFEFDEKTGLLFGKAFDCRIGCAALIEALRRLSTMELDVDVVGVLSSQEEVGDRGAKVSVCRVKPDVALCLEGCPADDTFTEPYAIQTALKKGPMFRHMDCSVICSPRLQRFILNLAAEKNMPAQESVREGGGNNAAVIQTSLSGIPAVTAGVPVRYIHAMNCISSYQDFEATASLISEIVKNLNGDVIKSF